MEDSESSGIKAQWKGQGKAEKIKLEGMDMEPELRNLIEKCVIEEMRNAFNEDGLINCIDLHFIDFEWDLFDIVKGIIPEDDDDEYDRIMGEADAIARNQFNNTMAHVLHAFSILDGALNITEK